MTTILIQVIEPITRDFLRKVAVYSPAAISPRMHVLLDDFQSKGLYAAATEAEIEQFDTLLDSMESFEAALK